MSQDRIPERFHALDSLRGIAALVVVLWHWQHFFYNGTEAVHLDAGRLPFADLLLVFYTKGWLGVELFFSLSGFIFYWLYSRPVAEGRMRTIEFAALRFSRLYPLHFATLIFVAAAQLLYLRQNGAFFVYEHNDVRHFLLHLGFASQWGLQSGLSFNGPVWSVSVEVLLYATFFVACRFLPARTVTIVALLALGYLLAQFLPFVGRGFVSFFLGAWAFRIYAWIAARGEAARYAGPVLTVTAAAWVAALAVFTIQSYYALPSMVAMLDFPGGGAIARACRRVFSERTAVVLFPLTIVALALVETRRGHFGRRCSFLGEISYSSYLLHFPLQIVAVGVVSALGLGREVFYSPAALIAFFILLIAASLASYRYFEAPAQRWLRGRLVLRHARRPAERSSAARAEPDPARGPH